MGILAISLRQGGDESGFSRKTEPVGCIYIEKETCNKELVHVIKEVSKSQGLQSELASWRDDDVVPVWRSAAQEPGRTDASVWVQRQKKRATIAVWRPSGRNNSTQRRSGFSTLFGLQLTWWGLLTLKRATCFTSSNYLNVNLIRKTLSRTSPE